MPNSLAYLALLLWPLVCLAAFRRLSVERAIIWSLLGGYLLLPPTANFNLPLLPSIDKTTLPSLVTFALCLSLYGRDSLRVPTGLLTRTLILIFVVGAIPTVLINSDPMVFTTIPNSEPIVFRSWQLPGLSFRDVFSALGNQMIAIVPFLLARKFLSSEGAMRDILLALVIAALVYSIPSLIEIRLSPQINVWVYGFFQHEFVQTMRAGGFRPIVFLPHSLWLAFFVMSALLAAAALARGPDNTVQPRFVFATFYLLALLFLCKSLASLAYGICLLPLVFFANARVLILLAASFAIIATIYPLLRGAGFVPVDAILDWARSINPERAASLAYRFGNEDMLLERAAEKPWLGWGGWGRNLVFDPETYDIITIPDGRWIIVFGTYGWLGYIAEFGLLSLPIFMLAREVYRGSVAHLSRHAAVIVLILATNMIDMLLNAALTPITWMMAGASLGYAEALRAKRLTASRKTLTGNGPIIGGTHSSALPQTLL